MRLAPVLGVAGVAVAALAPGGPLVTVVATVFAAAFVFFAIRMAEERSAAEGYEWGLEDGKRITLDRWVDSLDALAGDDDAD